MSMIISISRFKGIQVEKEGIECSNADIQQEELCQVSLSKRKRRGRGLKRIRRTGVIFILGRSLFLRNTYTIEFGGIR